MEEKLSITQEHTEHGLILKVEGRIDGYWSKHLDETLDEALRGGHYQIRLDLEDVDYLSSMGIRVLVKYTKQLRMVNGSFGLIRISENVSSVLEMAGLSSILTLDSSEIQYNKKTTENSVNRRGFRYTLQKQKTERPLECQVFGNPAHVTHSGFSAADCHPVCFEKNKFGIGLGAIGNGFEDCKSRFGEFVGLGNVVVYLPSGKSKSPDYMAKAGKLIPEIKALYGITFEGDFDTLVSFAPEDSAQTIPFSQLLSDLLELTGYESIAMVMLAETSGLVGTSLNLSPALQPPENGSSWFGFPQVRETLNYTTEPEFNQMMTLTVGIASRKEDPILKAFTRPSFSGSSVIQHFHSAVFSYYPLRKSEIDLEETIATFFELEKIQSILHLIHDERDSVGVGESEFSHGTCWIGKINHLTAL